MAAEHAQMLIRKCSAGEALELRKVFHSSVHELARHEYSAGQRAAWAPDEFDPEAWVAVIRSLDPWVVVVHGEIVAYADLQPDGYIDHFYVSGQQGRKGYGSALMAHVLAEANARRLAVLHAKVSLSAQPLFLKHGFCIRAVNTFMLRGVEISNATMVKQLRD